MAQNDKNKRQSFGKRNDGQAHKKYDYEAHEKLCSYVRRKYRNQLSNGALQLYLLGLPELEKGQQGLCQQIVATYDEIGRAACKDYSGLKKPLLELRGVLCDIQLGSPVKDVKKATIIRRFTLAELQSRKNTIIDNGSSQAKKLAEILESRSFIYGDQSVCNPYWNPTKTGRVSSREPNVQGDGKEKRVVNLLRGLSDGQVLFDIDIKQAEPSIIQHVLGHEFDSDRYNALAGAMKIGREEAKRELNKLAYAPSAAKVLAHWPSDAQRLFLGYAEALDQYKDRLWEKGKPDGKQRRFVDTLGGTRIVADRGERMHRGKLLNWHIQGTVADIINAASLEVIEREEVEQWQFLYPVHDSIYTVGNFQQLKDQLKEIISRKAQDLGLRLTVDVKVYTVGKTQ